MKYKSPQFDAVRGKLLTDKRIEHYILAGKYGSRRKQKLLGSIALAKKLKEQAKPKKKQITRKKYLQDFFHNLLENNE
tara:strand:- start:1852 stop:2085 length:234 start_codon:yes stop_codon:yes gene_type:complete